MGASFPTSGALGDGFPCEDARGRPLVIAVAGTGVAAARALMALRIEGGDATRTELFLGARTRAELPLGEELARWVGAGARVVACLSRESPSAVPDSVESARGYVQDIARARLTASNHGEAMIFAVGPQGLIDGMRAIGRALGIRETDIRSNY
jgi:NAD(P)H-flavin reductase